MFDDRSPTCWQCGRRIHLFESLWRELPSGAVGASYALELETLGRASRRLWHVGCYDPMAHPAPRLDRSPRGMPIEHLLAGAVI